MSGFALADIILLESDGLNCVYIYIYIFFFNNKDRQFVRNAISIWIIIVVLRFS